MDRLALSQVEGIGRMTTTAASAGTTRHKALAVILNILTDLLCRKESSQGSTG